MAVTVAAYLPGLKGQFVWDDDSWTTDISGLLRDAAGLWKMWSQPEALQQYYPLTGTSFWLDYQLWGFWTLPYHVENVLLHGLAALLFWRLLRRLAVPAGWLAAAIFALHPLMVESAGWITERKNVLSLVFYLSAVLAYGRFAGYGQGETGGAGAGARRPWGWFGLALGLFLAAYLAKATAFSLPAVLVLLAWWKRGRIQWRADVLPLLPFFALAIGLGLLTAWLEKHNVGAQGPAWTINGWARCLIAGRALWFYAGKLVCPAGLCFIYPRWQMDPASWVDWLWPVSALGVLVGLWLARNRLGRGPAVAVFYFAGTLFPVLGFLNAYFMRYSFVCDHWAYLSSLGLIGLAAALVARGAARLRQPALVYAFAAVVLPVLASLTWRQSKLYQNLESLWTATLDRNPNAYLAHNNYGNLLLGRGQVDEAMTHFQRALEIEPDFEMAQNNVGTILVRRGRLAEAIPYFRKALEIQPDYVSARNNLGSALMETGAEREALAQFQAVLDRHPADARTHYNLGNALLQKGRLDEAITHFQAALATDPDLALAHNNLGRALLLSGRLDDALAHFQKAFQLQPDNAAAFNNLNQAAWILATSPNAALRNGTRAVSLAEQLRRVSGGRNPMVMAALAAAYAEVGRFSDAVSAAQQAVQLADAQSSPALAHTLQSQLNVYRAGLPFRDPASAPPPPGSTPPR